MSTSTYTAVPEPEGEVIVSVPSTTTEQDVKKKRTAYPIIRHTDMREEDKADMLETITRAVENCPEYDLACKQIKEELDRYGHGPWNVVIGKSFGYEVTHEYHHIMYLYFMGNLGILVWKNN